MNRPFTLQDFLYAVQKAQTEQSYRDPDLFIVAKAPLKRCCRTCEYWDAGGEVAALTALTGDCLNGSGPRFNPEHDFVCDQWYPNTGKEKEKKDGNEGASE